MMQMTTDQMMFAQLLDMGGAANYLMWLNSPQMKPEQLLRTLAQMRKGGLTPELINELIEEIKGFRSARTNGDRVAVRCRAQQEVWPRKYWRG